MKNGILGFIALALFFGMLSGRDLKTYKVDETIAVVETTEEVELKELVFEDLTLDPIQQYYMDINADMTEEELITVAESAGLAYRIVEYKSGNTMYVSYTEEGARERYRKSFDPMISISWVEDNSHIESITYSSYDEPSGFFHYVDGNYWSIFNEKDAKNSAGFYYPERINYAETKYHKVDTKEEQFIMFFTEKAKSELK